MTGHNNKNLKLAAVLALSQAIATVSLAQTDAQNLVADATGSPGVTVADGGNRVIYSAAYFRQFNAVTARDQLDRVPGLQGILDGNDEDQRGFGSGGDQVLINGNRVS